MKITRKINSMIALSLLMLLPLMSMAQPGPMGRPSNERIEAQKVAFITERLSLTPAEAQVFWPLYNEHQAKREEIMNKLRTRNREMFRGDIDKVSEEEATKIIDDQIIEEQMMLDLRKEYHAKYKKVLPASKILRLYHVEREFKRVMLDRIRGPKRP